MKFTPKSEDEIKNANLLPEGVYDFKVFDAFEKTSKSGNEMIELKLIVWDNEGKQHFVNDYLLESMAFKLIHFCEFTGLSDKYKSGELTAIDCHGKKGKVDIKIQKGSENPSGGTYPDRNSVKDYVEFPVEDQKKDELIDDELPF